MSKISVKIVRETAKAKFVENEIGQQAWVQNRSYKDGLVTESVFAKSVKFTEELKEEKASVKEFADNFHLVCFEKETEKAILINVKIDLCNIEQYRNVDVWVPKSLCNNAANGIASVKGWFISKKITEIKESLRKYGPIVETFGNLEINAF